MSSIKAWIAAARLFAVPWVFANCFLGTSLAGFDLWSYLVASAIVSTLLISSHYANAWRDFVLGFDRVNGSVAKPYTAASQLIPSGFFTVREAKMATVGWYLAGLGLFVLFAPLRLDTVAIFAMGSFFIATYSDFWKRYGLGEIPLFMCHGFGSVVFAYSIIKPVDIQAIAAGVLMGLFAGLVYSIDQWQDVGTDFTKRVKDLAYIIAKANLKVSFIAHFAITMVVTFHMFFVIMNILPLETLKAILLLPMFYIAAVFLDYQFDKGVLMFLIAMWMYPVVMAV
jgi:1,4-dihydroxy-2-naphthoate octaprenyltransferase